MSWYSAFVLMIFTLYGCASIYSPHDDKPDAVTYSNKSLNEVTECVINAANETDVLDDKHQAVVIKPEHTFEIQPQDNIVVGGTAYYLRTIKEEERIKIVASGIGAMDPTEAAKACGEEK